MTSASGRRRQGIDVGRQGVDVGRQGVDVGRQGIDVGVRALTSAGRALTLASGRRRWRRQKVGRRGDRAAGRQEDELPGRQEGRAISSQDVARRHRAAGRRIAGGWAAGRRRKTS